MADFARFNKVFALTLALGVSWVGTMAPGSAQATTCVTSNPEILELALVSATRDGEPMELSLSPLQRFGIQRADDSSLRTPQLPFYQCVNLSETQNVSLTRKALVEPTPEARQRLAEIEAQRTPKQRVCGNVPYLAVHPGVYSLDAACGIRQDKDTLPWPAGATMTVDSTRTAVKVDFEREGQKYSIGYRVDHTLFANDLEAQDGCSVSSRSRTGSLSLMALLLLGSLRLRRPH